MASLDVDFLDVKELKLKLNDKFYSRKVYPLAKGELLLVSRKKTPFEPVLPSPPMTAVPAPLHDWLTISW